MAEDVVAEVATTEIDTKAAVIAIVIVSNTTGHKGRMQGEHEREVRQKKGNSSPMG